MLSIDFFRNFCHEFQKELHYRFWIVNVVIACCLILGHSHVRAEIILVGSTTVPFDEISVTKLRDLYTGQSQNVGAATVLVLDRNNSLPERSTFIHDTLGFTSEELKTVQRLLECIGISKAPTVVSNNQELITILNNNPNALGYMTKQEWLASDPKSLAKIRKIRILSK